MFLYFIVANFSHRKTHTDAAAAVETVTRRLRLLSAQNSACQKQNVSHPSQACKQYCLHTRIEVRDCFCAQIAGYSQDGHDLVAVEYFKSAQNNFFVDIDDSTGSSYLLEECLGWRGLCVESNNVKYNALANRMCTKVYTQVGATSGQHMTTLYKLLQSYDVKHVDFLSLQNSETTRAAVRAGYLNVVPIQLLLVANAHQNIINEIQATGYTVYKRIENDVFFYKN